jgi:hypothetical protein
MESLARSGGNPTGRKSKFRFRAGTSEGDEERRKADAQRKKEVRSTAAELVEPPPLPSLGEAAPDSIAATPGGEMPGPGSAVVETFVAWQSSDVKEFTDELVDLSEANRIEDFVKIAKEGALPASLVKQIEADAHFTPNSKAGLKTAVAVVSAKWLNKIGISARNKEEAALIFFGGSIWLQGRRLRGELKSLIDEDKKQKLAEEQKRAPLSHV